MEKSIVVVGAGIAGLSAGCYGQMNGYRTRIFELHNQPGGLCTAWTRQGYTFDGCIHWLVGSGPGTSFNRIWLELGALQGKRIVDHEEYLRVDGQDGRSLVLYTDADRLERHLKELSPADAPLAHELCDAIRLFARFDPPMDRPRESYGLLAGVQMIPAMLPFFMALRKWSKLPFADYAARFQDPFLREALDVVFGMPDFPALGAITMLGWMHRRDAGYPVGGSLEFARAIERRYLGLGGEIRYGSRVEKTLVENDRAVGVRLADGTEHRADVVVSAADGYATIYEMLGGKYVSDEVRGYYETLPIFRSGVQVSLGIARDLSREPRAVSFRLAEPITISGEARAWLTVQHYCYDPTLAPAGQSSVVVHFDSDYRWWQPLAEDRKRYEAEKRRIASAVVAELERRYPGIASQVEVVDVATPLTYVRHTGNWQGSIEGWLITTKTMEMMFGKGMKKTLPGLEGFYMVGQWVEPGGGLPSAAISGRNVIQMLCERDGRPFVARTP